jgi:hypothetical protein
MAETWTFAKMHSYVTRKFGITLPAGLLAGDKLLEFEAKVDPGSSLCVFPRRYGEELGFDIESGEYQRINTVTGGFDVFSHWATLIVLSFEYETTVYFAKYYDFDRIILGRQGWLNRIRLSLIDYEGKLYLSDYNDPVE